LSNYRTIVCIESEKKFNNFLSIIQSTHENTLLLFDLSALQLELMSDYKTVKTIFIDSRMIDKIDKDLSVLLELEVNHCIVLIDKESYGCERKSFIYDFLDYENICSISNFLIRLERDINRLLQNKALQNEVTWFYNIGKKLSSEKNLKILLDLIIKSCMEITSADAATIYAVIDSEADKWSTYEGNRNNKMLKFIIAKNNSIKIKLESTVSPIVKDSIFGYTVISGRPLKIDDAYSIPKDAAYKFNKKYDELTGYITKSILTIPMKDHENRVLGVIQLINKKSGNHIVPFTDKDETVIFSLAGQAAVSIENSILYKNMETLLEQYRLTITEEVTKRRLADDEINKLLSAVEHSPVSVTITDVNGVIQYVNPKFTQISGYSFNEAIGKTPRILNSGVHSKEFYDSFWKTILSGEEWRGEIFNKKKNGDFYWASSSVSSLKDEKGNIKYFVAIKEDITDKKLITKKLEDKNIELEKTIKKLNETQAQLIQKEKMAGIGQLAAGVAHEINNPLGYIMSNYEILKKYVNVLKESLTNYKKLMIANNNSIIREAKQEIEHILNFEKSNKVDYILEDLDGLFQDTNHGLLRVKDIVVALRSFSHIDQLKDFDEYDLNEGIHTTLLITRNYIPDDISIQESLDSIPLISAIGGEVNQVILNLVLNAVYATNMKNSGEKIINLKTYSNDEYVFFEIMDNGIGIAKENLNRIFEPFYTTKPVGEGTGLGLSIVYDIVVKKHKGEILVESKTGEGTRFTVKFPIIQLIHND